jgi:DNA end-binding protein Ku
MSIHDLAAWPSDSMSGLVALGFISGLSCGDEARNPSAHEGHWYFSFSCRHPLLAEVRLMATRPIWRGHLRLALVSCPVALWNARHDRGGIRFNLINPETGNRVKMVTTDADTGKELERRDLVKGYEFKKNQYLLLNDNDFDSVKVESSSVMTVEKFINTGSIDPIYYDAAYFLAPDGDAGRDVYAVLREAIARSGKTALSRVVIAQRERTIALRPVGDAGVIAHTLYEERDLNSSKELFDDLSGIKIDPEMVQLATQLVQRQAGQYDAADLEDRYESRLRAMLDAKMKGEGIVTDAEAPVSSTGKVIDLMAALKKSLGQAPAENSTVPKSKKVADTRQTGLKLPIKGGKDTVRLVEKPPAPAAKLARKRA